VLYLQHEAGPLEEDEDPELELHGESVQSGHGVCGQSRISHDGDHRYDQEDGLPGADV